MITITEPANLAQFAVGSTVQFKGTNGPVSEVIVVPPLLTAVALGEQSFAEGTTAVVAPWEQSVGPFNTPGVYVVTVRGSSGKTASRTITIV